jgi:hypothetical protein
MAASLSQYRNAVTLVHHVIPRRERGEILKIIKVIQSVAEISAIAAGLPCKSRHGPSREWHPERWPSGLRRTLGKRVCGKLYRGFESHSLRQQVISCTMVIIQLMAAVRNGHSSTVRDIADRRARNANSGQFYTDRAWYGCKFHTPGRNDASLPTTG